MPPTPRQVVIDAVNHRPTDTIPYFIQMEEGVRRKLIERYGGEDKLPRHETFLAGTGWDWRAEELPGGRFRDKFGVLWTQGTTFHIIEPVLPEPTLQGFEFPRICPPEDIPALREWCENNADRFRTYNLGLLFFERSWALRGMQNILMDMVLHPDFAHELFDRLMELHLDALDRLLELPFDSIRFGDDFGGQNGTIMGLKHWRTFIKPRLEKMYGRVRDAGKIVSIHSCGDNSEILGEMIEMGLRIFNPSQPEPQDLGELKTRYGDRVTFEGGIGSQSHLPFGTPEEVREEIRLLRRRLGSGGGLIMGPTKSIREETPVENAAAALETIIEECNRGTPT